MGFGYGWVWRLVWVWGLMPGFPTWQWVVCFGVSVWCSCVFRWFLVGFAVGLGGLLDFRFL